MAYDPFAPGLFDRPGDLRPEPLTRPSEGRQGFFENFVNSFMTDTWIGQGIRRGQALSAIDRENAFPAITDPDWNPITHSDLKGYEQFIDRFYDATSPREVELIKRMIDANVLAKREMEYGGAGWSRFASGLVDPTNAIPLPGLAGIGFLRGAKTGAMAFGGLAASTDLARHALDPTSQPEELVASIGAGTLLGAALGGPLGRWGRFRADLPGGPPTPPPAAPGTRQRRFSSTGDGPPVAEFRDPDLLESYARFYHDAEQHHLGPPKVDFEPRPPVELQVEQQLLGIGMAPAEARANASLHGAFVGTLKSRYGLDDVEVAAFYNKLKIGKETGAELDKMASDGGSIFGFLSYIENALDKESVHLVLRDPEKSGKRTITTFAHESAHYWDYMLRQLAAEGNRKAGEDVAHLNQLLGKHAQTLYGDEIFAVNFEKYLATGRAPTRGLIGVFEAFRAWVGDLISAIWRRQLWGGRERLSPEMADFFGMILGGKKATQRVDFRINRDVGQHARFIDDMMSEIQERLGYVEGGTDNVPFRRSRRFSSDGPAPKDERVDWKAVTSAWAKLVDPQVAAIAERVAATEKAMASAAKTVDDLKGAIADVDKKLAAAGEKAEPEIVSRFQNQLDTLLEDLKAAEGTLMLRQAEHGRVMTAAKESNGQIDDFALKSTHTGLEGFFANIRQMPWYRLVQNAVGGDLQRRLGKIAHELAASPGLLTRGAERGVAPPPSVEYAARVWHAVMQEAVDEMENQYLKYLGYEVTGRLPYLKETVQQNVIDPIRGFLKRSDRLQGKMTQREFGDAVFIAMVKKGESDNSHVSLSASAFNNAQIKFFEAAHEVGLYKTMDSMTKHIDFLVERAGQIDTRIDETVKLRTDIATALAAIKDLKIPRGGQIPAAAKPLLRFYQDAIARAKTYEATVVRPETRTAMPPSEYPERVQEAIARYDNPKPGDDRVLGGAMRRNKTDDVRVVYVATPAGQAPHASKAVMLLGSDLIKAERAGKLHNGAFDIHEISFPAGSGHLEMGFGTLMDLRGGRLEPHGDPVKAAGQGREYTIRQHIWTEWPPAEKPNVAKAASWAERRIAILDNDIERLSHESAGLQMERHKVETTRENWQGMGGDDKPEWYVHTMYDRPVIERKRQLLEDRLYNYFSTNPVVYLNGKRLELDVSPDRIRARAKEAVDTIQRDADFQNGLGNLDISIPGDTWRETAIRLRTEAAKYEAAGRTEQAAKAVRQAAWLEKAGGEGKLETRSFGSASPLMSRKLSIPRELLLDAGDGEHFIRVNAPEVMNAYAAKMGASIEMARRFDDRPNLIKTISGVKDEFDKLITQASEADDSKRVMFLQAERTKQLQAIEDLRDKVLGHFGLGENPASWGPRAVRMATAYSALTHMGKAWLASWTDPAKIMMTEGVLRTFGHMFDGFTQWLSRDENVQKWIRKGGEEVQQAGGAAELTRATRAMALISDNSQFAMIGQAERTLHSMTRFSFVMNGLAVWTDMMKRFGGSLAMSRIIEDSLKLSRGEEVPKFRRQLLVAAGFDEHMQRAIAREWQAAGGAKFRSSFGGDFYLANTNKWVDRQTAEAFRVRLNQEVDRLVISPGVSDRPNFMYHPVGQLMLQYRQFAMSSLQRVAMSAMQRDDAVRIQGIMAMVAFGAIIDSFRSPDYANFDLGSRVYRAVELSGVLGILTDMNNAAETVSGNSVGLRPMLGIPPMLKNPSWAQQVGAVTGPASTMFLQSLWAFTSPDAHGDDRARALRYMVPFNNNFLGADFFSRAQRGLAGVLE